MLSSLRISLVRHGKSNPTTIITEGNPLTFGADRLMIDADRLILGRD